MNERDVVTIIGDGEMFEEDSEGNLTSISWTRVIEMALGLDPDPSHTKRWAYDTILKVRELGNRR
jgi:hypothetical protein